ncbi:MAG TPA: sialidase family protein [Planctomycetia bacterium]|nr:sialidase family protein [Planctomycetia bacterium]
MTSSFLFAAILAAADPQAGDVADVVVVADLAQHPGFDRLWEPYLALWSPRQYVIAYGAHLAGKGDMGSILATVSRDAGKTWTRVGAIFDHLQRNGTVQYAYANPVLYRPPGQDVLWCFAMRCPMNRPHSEDSQICAAFSADGGYSWSPVELAMHYTGPAIIVGGVLRVDDPSGPRYLLPVHRNTRRTDPLGTRDQLVLESTSLLEWRLPKVQGKPLAGVVPQPAAGPVFLHEGQLAPGEKPGEVLMVMRTASYDRERALDPPRAYSTKSADYGRTWTAAVAEPDLHNSVSKAFFGRSASGACLYVYSDGPQGRRTSLRYKVKPAGGAWSAERTFFDAGIKNSYPTLIETAPDRFACTWDSGTKDRPRTSIRFGTLALR